MRKKILFVDDDENLLKGLRRTLHSMRTQWDMEFVSSGAEALDRMRETSFDIIVSDMQMPGVTGAQLLNEAMRLYPRTVRFILSGHAAISQILQSSGAAHQFLAKPYDVELLKKAIDHADVLQKSLQDEGIKELVAKIDRLPSMPTLYLELEKLIRNPDVGVAEIGAVVAKDMGMTAKILKLVNSAFFGSHSEVASIAAAIGFLGVETIRSLVLSMQAFSQFQASITSDFDIESLWTHSMKTASVAQSIARTENAARILVDESSAGGFLHDIGILVLAANFPKKFQTVVSLTCNEKNMSFIEAEQRVFGANHAEVGGCILNLWGLPKPIVDAVFFHHRPGQSGDKAFSPLTAVHAANAMVSHPEIFGEAGQLMDMEYLAALGLTEHTRAWRNNAAKAALS